MTEIGAPVSVLGTVSASQAAKAGDCVVLGEDMKIPAGMVPSSGGGGMTVLSESAATPQWIYGNLEVGDLVYIDGGVSTAGGYWTTFYGICIEKGDDSFELVGSGVAEKMPIRDNEDRTYYHIFRLVASNQVMLTGTYVSGTSLATVGTYLSSVNRVILYKSG